MRDSSLCPVFESSDRPILNSDAAGSVEKGTSHLCEKCQDETRKMETAEEELPASKTAQEDSGVLPAIMEAFLGLTKGASVLMD